jgi:transposase InsO family protein
MTNSEYELKKKEICDFRYSVVGELANPYLQRGELVSMIKEKSNREYNIPYSKRTRVTEGCIRRWLNLYKKYGMEGLVPGIRYDCGKSRVLEDAQQTALINLLESNPELTATAAVKKLQDMGIIKKKISSSSLSRFIISQGLTSAQRNKEKVEEKTLKFNFFSPLECIQVDVMYGPTIPDEKGKLRKALLMAFLDDATRRIVYSRFSFSEKSILFEDGIKHILKTHGMIGRLYTDNGSSFISNQTKRILNIIGITLTHSRPGIPKGRGKVERFFRTLRDQFERPLNGEEIQNIDALNARFHTWLECEYHRSNHRGLDKDVTPLDAWLAKVNHIQAIKPGVDLDRIFLHMVSRKVYKDSTFTLMNTLFEAPSILSGKSINVYYDPHPPVLKVFISHGGKDYGDARIVNTYANSQVKRGSHSKKNVNEDKVSGLPATLLATNMGES